MKHLICAIATFVILNLTAQTTPNPLGVTTSNSGVSTPGSAPVTGETLSNNFLGFGFVNSSGQPFNTSDLSSALAALQNNVQQILPMLSAFNGNFVYVPSAAFQTTPAGNP